GDDADDFADGVRVESDAHLAADGIRRPERLPRQRLVDDHHRLRVADIEHGEPAAPKNRQPDRFEIAGRWKAEAGVRRASFGHGRRAFDVIRGALSILADRYGVDRAGGIDADGGGELTQQVLDKADAAFARSVRPWRQRDAERHGIAGRETWID